MSLRAVLRALGRGSAWTVAKQLVAVTLVVAATVTFAIFSPSYRYAQSEGLRQASFDLWLNGPLESSSIAQLKALDANASYAAVVDFTPLYIDAGGRRSSVDNGRLFDDAASIPLVYPSSLRLGGAPFDDLQPDQIIIDSRTSDAIGVGVGATVVVGTLDGQGNQVDVTRTVASIVLGSAHLRASVGALIAPDWRSTLPADAAPYSSLFVATAHPDVFKSQADRSGGDLVVFERTDLLNTAVAQANELVDTTREISFLVIACGVLLVFVIRDLRALLALRSRAAAILIAMGVRPLRIAAAVLAEQLAVLTVALIAGTAIGLAWYGVAFHLPVAVNELGLLVASLAVLFLVAILATVLLVTRRLSSVPIAKLLFEGS
jgi:hypothetical protein